MEKNNNRILTSEHEASVRRKSFLKISTSDERRVAILTHLIGNSEEVDTVKKGDLLKYIPMLHTIHH